MSSSFFLLAGLSHLGLSALVMATPYNVYLTPVDPPSPTLGPLLVNFKIENLFTENLWVVRDLLPQEVPSDLGLVLEGPVMPGQDLFSVSKGGSDATFLGIEADPRPLRLSTRLRARTVLWLH